jgi:hypothetical protein
MSVDASIEPFFSPWKGDIYGSKDVRLLILGESHHGTNPTPDWTVNVVRRYIANKETESWFPTFTKIGQVVTGRKRSEIDRSQFWNSIAFYNYVQEVVAGFARGPRPTPEMFTRSQPAFQEVISELRPTHILALGMHLWRNMPPSSNAHGVLACEGKSSDCRHYASRDSSHHALAIGIKHPSAGFSAPAWHPLVAKFLSLTA